MKITLRGERGNTLSRYLDYLIGVPLIFFLRFFKKRREVGKINKIAVLNTAAIGDSVLMSAAIANLRHSFNDATIDIFCGKSNIDAVNLINGVSNVIFIPVKRPYDSIKIIRQYGYYDIWFDFGQWPRINAIYSFFSRSYFTVGFRTKGQHRHYLYDNTVTHSSNNHEIDNQLRFIGLLIKDPIRNLSVRDPQVTVDNKLIIFHPFPGGSRHYLKKWANSNWNKLSKIFLSKGFHIKVTGGADNKTEANRMFLDILSHPGFDIVAGDLTLGGTAQLLKRAQLVISVNTGIMHLASALRCNLIALHGPTSAKRWGPLNENSIAIQSKMRCSPCLNLGFEYGCSENKCMQNISVDEVIEESKSFL